MYPIAELVQIILCPRKTWGKISHRFAAWKSLKLRCCFRQLGQTLVAKFKIHVLKTKNCIVSYISFFLLVLNHSETEKKLFLQYRYSQVCIKIL